MLPFDEMTEDQYDQFQQISRVLKQQYELTLHACTMHHWQIRDRSRLLAELWPTKYKMRPMWPKPTQTVDYGGPTEFTRMVLARARMYRQSTVPEPAPQSAQQPTERRRVSVDLELKGTELTVCVRGQGYASRTQLNAADTEAFLLKAARALRAIEAR